MPFEIPRLLAGHVPDLVEDGGPLHVKTVSGAVVAEKVGTTWTKGYVMLGG